MFTLVELAQPNTIEEAYELLIKRKNNIVIGGSAFLRMGKKRIGTGIDLSNLGLNYIKEDEEYVEIGAMTTFRDLEISPILSKHFSNTLQEAVKDIIGIQFRSVVTVGASVFSKYGFSDLIVALLALDAEVETYNKGRMSLESFLENKYEKDILVKVFIKKNKETSVYKSMRNAKSDYAILNISISKDIDSNIRMCVGARPQRATLAKSASEFITTNGLSEENIIKASKMASEELVFGSNMRASGEYRKAICESLIKTALMEVASC